ncbi:hypothetical protein FA95DRAFT_653497 [Auriscalpium vulgare]|uniref:Uncharacterized protein n=1 Tax=Auriscalpium vulgare TaxID=40419 RepID=A0ACB8RCR8_9AGAM|nr:hypothetical protein FA95DRAFT_653497 [Auriscalpium vulgare]
MGTTPLDIQAIVLGEVYRSSQHAAIDYPTLRACALVCRNWTPIAQRLLLRRAPYPSIHVSNPRNHVKTALFLRTLRAAPMLATHVRVVTLYIQPLHVDDDNTFEVLKLCTNLNGIYLNGIDVDSMDVRGISCMGVLPKPFLARLEAIPIRPTFLSVAGSSAVVDRVINIWPSVRTLDVLSWWSTPSEQPQVRMPRALHSLEVSARTVRRHWSAPTAVAPALRDAELQGTDWNNAALSAALVTSGILTQLRTLVVDHVPSRAVSEMLAGLETLVLASLPHRICTLPRGLWHLGYHLQDAGYDDQVVHARLLLDAARTLPKLRLVTATRRSSPEVLEEFERVCRARRFDFAMYVDPKCFPRPRNVDWI